MKVSAPAVTVADPPAPIPTEPADPNAPPSVEGSEAGGIAPPEVAPAKWPEWFEPVDIALAILAAVLAFLLASYTARNPDIWRHMGTGRLIVQGHYPIGGDPLSFGGADRGWINSNWLYDVVMYSAFSADDTGTAAVVLKALAFAAAFGVLFLLRKPDRALWPWAVMAALGAIATGSMASLRPHVFGMLLESTVLALLYRGNWAGSKWRTPALFGLVCWVWACTDSFFFLGPLTAGLVLLGERLQSSFAVGKSPAESAADPFWPAPPRAALLRGLLCGLAGVLLNPVFLGALVRSPLDALGQMIPFELTFGWGDAFAGDPSLSPIILSPLDAPYTDTAERGNNVTGYAAVALVAIGGLLLGVGASRLKVAHVLLWVAFVSLALVHYRFIPVAIVVGIPLAAGHLNGLSRFRLRGTFDPTTKAILNLSGVGRILSVTLLLALIAATIPGYLHAPFSTNNPAYNRRVSWGIEEEVGLSRGAKLIGRWRAEGRLPPDTRALQGSYEFGDYCAWFAPAEKVFLDSRFRFHADRLGDLAAIRGELRKRPTEEELMALSSSGKLKEMADTYKADLFVLGQWNQRVGEEQIYAVEADFTADKSGRTPPNMKLHMDGRVAILCRPDTESGKSLLADLRYSPEREAFGLDAIAVPSVQSKAHLVPVDSWLADFQAPPPQGSVATDDAILFQRLGQRATQIARMRWQFRLGFSRTSYLFGDAAMHTASNPGPVVPTAEELAYTLMAHRAARRAISETPDDPEPYFALGEAYAMPHLGGRDPKEGELQQMTSFRRFLDRVPVTPRGPIRFARSVIEAELSLFLLHLESGQMDSALDAVSRANAKIKTAAEGDLPAATRLKQVRDYYRQKMAELELGAALQKAVREPKPDELQRLRSQIYESVLDSDFDKGETRDNPKPKDAAWVRTRSQGLEDRVKRRVGQFVEGYTQRTANAGIAQRFRTAVESGLTGRAIDMIYSEADWPGVSRKALSMRVSYEEGGYLGQRFGYLFATADSQDMNDGSLTVVTNPIGLNLQTIAFDLQSGGLDRAAQQIKNVSNELDNLEKENAGDIHLARYRAAIKQLLLLQARLEGDFKKVNEDALEGLQRFPKLTPGTAEQLAVPFEGLILSRAAVCGGTLPMFDRLGAVRAALVQEARHYFDSGMMALLSGDNPEARARFAMALKPQGVPLSTLGVGPEDPISFYAARYSAPLEKHAGNPSR